jgi:hypothetical protein
MATISLQDMLVYEVRVKDAGPGVEGRRGGNDNVLAFFVLQNKAEQTHYKVILRQIEAILDAIVGQPLPTII